MLVVSVVLVVVSVVLVVVSIVDVDEVDSVVLVAVVSGVTMVVVGTVEVGVVEPGAVDAGAQLGWQGSVVAGAGVDLVDREVAVVDVEADAEVVFRAVMAGVVEVEEVERACRAPITAAAVRALALACA